MRKRGPLVLKTFEQLEQAVRSVERRTVAIACGDDPGRYERWSWEGKKDYFII